MFLHDFDKSVIMEGGNVFADTDGIPKEQAQVVLANLRKSMPVALANKMFATGSAGHKPISGDMDVMLDAKALLLWSKAKDIKTAKAALSDALHKKGIDTKLSGVSVHAKIPMGTKFAQVDIMIVEDAETISKYHQHDYGQMGTYKGAHKHIILSGVAKTIKTTKYPNGLMWSAWQGLYSRDADGKKADFITRDPNKVAQILLSPKATLEDLKSPQAIVTAIAPAERKKKLAHVMAEFEKEGIPFPQPMTENETGPKFTGYWKGTDKGTPGKKMVGSTMENKMNSKELINQIEEDGNPTDKITMDIPLFIRMMEYAKEDAKTDMDLHSVTERAIELMQQHDYLCMDNYNDLVGGEATGGEQPVEEDFEYNNPNLSPAQRDNINKLIQKTIKNKPIDVDKLVKDPRPYKDRLPQGNLTAPMPVYDKNVPSFMPTTKVKSKQYVSASKDIEQTDEDWLDKVYAAGRNFADTASLGTYKYARAGADYAAKNIGNKLGFDIDPTTYQKELDQEIEKLDKDYKNEPAASLAGMAGAMAIPVAGEYGTALKGAQGLAGQALDTYGKATKIYPLAKAALGFKEDSVDENKLTYKDSLETWVARFKEKYPDKDSVTIKKMAAAAKYRSIQDKKIEEAKKMKNPCWKGYTPYGLKMKDGKKVPNCVPVKKD